MHFYDNLKYSANGKRLSSEAFERRMLLGMVPRIGGGQVTSIRSNSQPSAGTTATQPVTPNGALTPQDIASIVEQLTPASARFRQQSSIIPVALDSSNWTAIGQTDTKRISSVGLGLYVLTQHVINVSLVNASTAAQAVSVSSLYPYNQIAKEVVAINGGATVFSASGIAELAVATRRFRSAMRLDTRGGFGPALSPALCRISMDTKGTPTNATAGAFPAKLSGISSISVAGSSTCVVTSTFYTLTKLTLDNESMLGALPLQNNSTFATIETDLASAFLGGTQAFPFYVSGGIPTTLTATMTGTSTRQYFFASVPPDPGLYQAMVANSYQVQEQPNITVSATGVGALNYSIPQNQYLVALECLGFNGNTTGDPILQSDFLKDYIQYNAGSVIPITQQESLERARQYFSYGNDLAELPGYHVWDGQDTTNDLQAASDNMGWIDCYNAATPQYVADLASTLTTNLTFQITRESVVAGSVQVVGG